MKILVCLKQVPDTTARLAPKGAWIDEEGVAFVTNEFDLFALEAALRFKDADPATEVVVATIGGERVKTAVRDALARGADRAVHLQDAAFQDGDPWSNSIALAAVAKREGPFDLVLTGLQASDDNFGQTGALLAERLGIPCATAVMEWSLAGTTLNVERELEGDRRESVSLPLPCVATFQTGAGHVSPRYGSIKGIMAAKKKEVKTPTPADLDVSPSDVGAAGRRMTVLSLAEPPKQAGAEMLTGPASDVAREIVKRIRERTGLL